MSLLGRIGISAPIVQAGLGGGLSGHELAVAVSEAGGLGTIAVTRGPSIRRELEAARRETDRPVAVNLLLPFADRSSLRAARAADVVVTFWGRPVRPTAGLWLHQVGSLSEALAAAGAGADGVIVQGVEAGGHVRGSRPGLDLLEEVRAAIPRTPLLLAGGIAERGDVAAALEAGAEAVVVGTRFLMAAESRAHERYKQRLCEQDETVLTDLFGFGWPAPHRVLPNATTRNLLRPDGSTPLRLRLTNRLSDGLPVPVRAQLQRVAIRAPRLAYAPQPMTTVDAAELVELRPLYAGRAVARMKTIEPAAKLVAVLTP